MAPTEAKMAPSENGSTNFTAKLSSPRGRARVPEGTSVHTGYEHMA